MVDAVLIKTTSNTPVIIQHLLTDLIPRICLTLPQSFLLSLTAKYAKERTKLTMSIMMKSGNDNKNITDIFLTPFFICFEFGDVHKHTREKNFI